MTAKIKKLLQELNKLLPSKHWHIMDVENERLYLFYKNKEICNLKRKTPSVKLIIKFIKFLIIDSPESFGIKKIICQLKKKNY